MKQGKIKFQFKNSIEKFKDLKQQFANRKQKEVKQDRSGSSLGKQQLQQNQDLKNQNKQPQEYLEDTQSKLDRFDSEESTTSLTTEKGQNQESFVPKFNILDQEAAQQKQSQQNNVSLLKSASQGLKGLDTSQSKEFFRQKSDVFQNDQDPNDYSKIHDDGMIENKQSNLNNDDSFKNKQGNKSRKKLRSPSGKLNRSSSQDMENNTKVPEHMHLSELQHNIQKSISLPMKKLLDLQPHATDYQTYRADLLEDVKAKRRSNQEKNQSQKVLSTVLERDSTDESPRKTSLIRMQSRRMSHDQKNLIMDRNTTNDELLLSKLNSSKAINFQRIPKQNDNAQEQIQQQRAATDKQFLENQGINQKDKMSDTSSNSQEKSQQSEDSKELPSSPKYLSKSQSQLPIQSLRAALKVGSQSFDRRQWVQFNQEKWEQFNRENSDKLDLNIKQFQDQDTKRPIDIEQSNSTGVLEQDSDQLKQERIANQADIMNFEDNAFNATEQQDKQSQEQQAHQLKASDNISFTTATSQPLKQDQNEVQNTNYTIQNEEGFEDDAFSPTKNILQQQQHDSPQQQIDADNKQIEEQDTQKQDVISQEDLVHSKTTNQVDSNQKLQGPEISQHDNRIGEQVNPEQAQDREEDLPYSANETAKALGDETRQGQENDTQNENDSIKYIAPSDSNDKLKQEPVASNSFQGTTSNIQQGTHNQEEKGVQSDTTNENQQMQSTNAYNPFTNQNQDNEIIEGQYPNPLQQDKNGGTSVAQQNQDIGELQSKSQIDGSNYQKSQQQEQIQNQDKQNFRNNNPFYNLEQSNQDSNIQNLKYSDDRQSLAQQETKNQHQELVNEERDLQGDDNQVDSYNRKKSKDLTEQQKPEQDLQVYSNTDNEGQKPEEYKQQFTKESQSNSNQDEQQHLSRDYKNQQILLDNQNLPAQDSSQLENQQSSNIENQVEQEKVDVQDAQNLNIGNTEQKEIHEPKFSKALQQDVGNSQNLHTDEATIKQPNTNLLVQNQEATQIQPQSNNEQQSIQSGLQYPQQLEPPSGVTKVQPQSHIEREISLGAIDKDTNDQIEKGITQFQQQPQNGNQTLNNEREQVLIPKTINQQMVDQTGQNKGQEQLIKASQPMSNQLDNEPISRIDSFGELSRRELKVQDNAKKGISGVLFNPQAQGYDSYTAQAPDQVLDQMQGQGRSQNAGQRQRHGQEINAKNIYVPNNDNIQGTQQPYSSQAQGVQLKLIVGDLGDITVHLGVAEQLEGKSYNPYLDPSTIPYINSKNKTSGRIYKDASDQFYAESFAFDNSEKDSVEAQNNEQQLNDQQQYQNLQEESVLTSDSDFEFMQNEAGRDDNIIQQQDSLGNEKLFKIEEKRSKKSKQAVQNKSQQGNSTNPFYDQGYVSQKVNDTPLLQQDQQNQYQYQQQNPYYQQNYSQPQQAPKQYNQGSNYQQTQPQYYQQSQLYYPQQYQYSEYQQVNPQYQQLQQQPYYGNYSQNMYQGNVQQQRNIQDNSYPQNYAQYNQQNIQQQLPYTNYNQNNPANQQYLSQNFANQSAFQQQQYYNQQQQAPPYYNQSPQSPYSSPTLSSPQSQQSQQQQYQQVSSPNQYQQQPQNYNQNNVYQNQYSQGFQIPTSASNPFYTLQNSPQQLDQAKDQDKSQSTLQPSVLQHSPQYQTQQTQQNASISNHQQNLQDVQSTQAPKNSPTIKYEAEIVNINAISIDEFLAWDFESSNVQGSTLQLRDYAMQAQTMQGVVKLLNDNSLRKLYQYVLSGSLSHQEIFIAYLIVEKCVDAAIYALKEILGLTTKEVQALFDLNQPRQSLAQQVAKKMKEIDKNKKLSMLTQIRRAGFDWYNIMPPNDVEELFQSLIVQHSRYYNVVQLSSHISITMWKLFYVLKIQNQIAEGVMQVIEGFYKSFNYIQQTTILNLSIDKYQQGVDYLAYICQTQEKNDIDQILFGTKKNVEQVYHVNTTVEKVAKEVVEMNAGVVLIESLRMHKAQDQVVTNSCLAILTLGTLSEWCMVSILKSNACEQIMEVLFPKKDKQFKDYLSLLATEVDVIKQYNKANKDQDIKKCLESYDKLQTKLSEEHKTDSDKDEEDDDNDDEPELSINDVLTPPSVQDHEFINYWKDDPAYSVQFKSRNTSFNDSITAHEQQSWGSQKSEDTSNITGSKMTNQPQNEQYNKFNAVKSMSHSSQKEHKKFKLSSFKKMSNSAGRQFTKFMRDSN